MSTLRLLACVTVYVLGIATAIAQTYPSKPIRILTGSVGGASDFSSRQIALGISGPLGQSVIVDNRTGIGEAVAKSPPDGYVLLFDGGSFWLGPLMQQMGYDPVKDFSPITLAASSPNVLVVHPSVAANSVKDFIALAKAKPGALNFSTGGTGSLSHLAGELFKSLAGVNIVRVGYSSGSAEYADLLGGQVQLTFGGASSVTPHVKSGKLKALAVTSAQPSALFPTLPTISAGGLPGYDAVLLQGLFAPAKTPPAIIARLNQEVVRTLNTPEVKERFLNFGVEAVGTSADDFGKRVSSEMTRWGKLIKDAGIRAD